VPPRANATPEQILDITFHLIAEHDVSGVSVDMVAAKAGVSKATVYRRWSSRTALFTEAMTRVRRLEADPDTGSLREDLTVMLKELVGYLNRRDTSRVMASFLNAAVRSPELAKLQQQISQDARAPYKKALQRAIERGEISSKVDVRLLVEVLISPFLFQGVVEHKRVRTQDVEPVVETVLTGVGHRPK
jgi:AcrR family transcriptional regulator